MANAQFQTCASEMKCFGQKVDKSARQFAPPTILLTGLKKLPRIVLLMLSNVSSANAAPYGGSTERSISTARP